MNKTCARCQKVVYPIEELKCLDKTWHKTCFKCTECGMALNMKTYKGYNKMPYCEAHIPKAKATAIADTPELKRIAENTKIQSNVKYHADFEKAKGKFTQVADDPETLRIKQNTKHISNVAYHGDLEKKAAMEKQRGSAEVSDSSTTPQAQQQQQQQPQAVNNYNQLRSAILHNSHHPSGNAVDQYDAQQQQQQAPLQQQHSHSSLLNNNNASNGNIHNSNNGNNNISNSAGGLAAHPASLSYTQQQLQQQQQQQHQQPPQQTRSQASVHSNNSASKLQQQQQQQQQLQQQQSGGNLQQLYVAPNYTAVTPSENALGAKLLASNGHLPVVQQQQSSSNNIGKIADYDPLTDGPRAMPNAGRSTTTLVYSSDQQRAQATGGTGNSVYPKRIGAITDIDPVNGVYGSLSSAEQAQAQKQQQYYQQVQLMQQQQQQQHANYDALQDKQSRGSTALRVYRAIYDYEAQDVDEVSFREGDVIFEVESIDSGWMTGRVERTGKTGMLPANYVEQAVI